MFVDISRSSGSTSRASEAVLLTADAALELTANPTRTHAASRSRPTSTVAGPVATCSCSRARWRSATRSSAARPTAGRAMLDENGETMDVALPSRAVQVLGLTSVPRAGDTFIVAPDDRTARQIARR